MQRAVGGVWVTCKRRFAPFWELEEARAGCCCLCSRSLEEPMECDGNVHLHLGPGHLAHVFGVEDEEEGGFGPRPGADDDAQHHPCKVRTPWVWPRWVRVRQGEGSPGTGAARNAGSVIGAQGHGTGCPGNL